MGSGVGLPGTHEADQLRLLGEQAPLLVTDLDRPSLTDDPAARTAIEAGRARDGSSTALLMVSGFDWSIEEDVVRLRFPDVATATVAQALRDRLPHGRELLFDGNGTRVVLMSAEVFAVRQPSEGLLEVDLPAEAVAALA